MKATSRMQGQARSLAGRSLVVNNAKATKVGYRAAKGTLELLRVGLVALELDTNCG